MDIAPMLLSCAPAQVKETHPAGQGQGQGQGGWGVTGRVVGGSCWKVRTEWP